jgi:hypothetical protein
MYQKFNINPNFFRQTTIKNSQNHFEAIVTLEQNILVVIFNDWHFYFYIHQVLCLHMTNILIHNPSITKSPVSMFSVAKRGVPNCDLFNIIVKGGRVMVFCFVQNFFFGQHESKNIYFFPWFNIRLYDKNSESDYFFSLHQNQTIFFSNIGNQNIFLEKKP